MKSPKVFLQGAVMVIKWSTYSPSTPTITVRLPLKPTVFVTFCV